MSEVSAQEILDIFNSNRGSKTERLNQIAELCQAALDADGADATDVVAEEPEEELVGEGDTGGDDGGEGSDE